MTARHVTTRAFVSTLTVLLVAGTIGAAPAGAVSHAAPAAMSARAAAGSRQNVLRRSFDAIPLSFEPNRGQAGPGAAFFAHGHGYALALSATGAALTLSVPDTRVVAPLSALARPAVPAAPVRQATVRMALLGANAAAHGQGQGRLPGTVSYVGGRVARGWLTHIPTFAAVRFAGVYPGVDLLYYGNQQRLEYDFRVAPGADPGRIRLSFQGVNSPAVAANGDLILPTSAGIVRQRKPAIYQFIHGTRRTIRGGYALSGRTVSIRVGPYDRHAPLVIDPVVVYSTYYGGGGDDLGTGVAVDGQGNAYVVGTTSSVFASRAAFVAEFDPTGTKILNTVYFNNTIGSTGKAACDSTGSGIAVDAQGNVYATGTYGDVDEFNLCNNQAVLWVKIDSSGAISTKYFGQYGGNQGQAIALDSQGNTYLTGSTDQTETNFPVTPGAYQPQPGIDKGAQGLAGDAFVLKIDPNGNEVYGTFLGGSYIDNGLGIAVDGQGNAFVVGTTGSANFPVTSGAFQAQMSNAVVNAFVSEISADGSTLLYSTFLGGNTGESANGVAVDAQGRAYVVGSTDSPDFPTTSNAYSRSCGGNGMCSPIYTCYWDPGSGSNYCHWQNAEDVFVAKFDTTQSGAASLLYSTFLGGYDRDLGQAITVDANGAAYVTGRTGSMDFPVRAASQAVKSGDYDAFLAKLDPGQAGDASLIYSTYLGGSGYDEGDGIALDANGNAYVTGCTRSPDFPTLNPAQATYNGGYDIFLTKFSPATPATLATVTLDHASLVGGGSATGTVTLSGPAPAIGAAVALSSTAPSVVAVPATVTVPSGATAANFTVSTQAVSAPAGVTLVASYNGAQASATLNVLPPATPTPTNTAVPPTATRTNTAVPPTATPTNTALPPTATSTRTAVPPMATATRTALPGVPTSTTTSVPGVPTSSTTSVPGAPTATNTAVPGAPTATPTLAGSTGGTGSGTPTATPTLAGRTTPTATPGAGSPPPPATDTPVSRPATSTPVPPARKPRQLLSFKVTLPHGGVVNRDAVTVRIHASARAHLTITGTLTHTLISYSGRGRHRKRVTRTVVAYQTVRHASADAKGYLTYRLRLTYAPPATVHGRLTITVRAAQATAQYSTPATALPLRHGRA